MRSAASTCRSWWDRRAKHFLLHESVEETKFATAAAVTAAILGGAHLVRVHDVREMRAAADVADEILQQNAPKESW